MENIKAEIKMSDLEKVDIRVGTIELVEDVPKSDKLVKLTVDFGTFKRTILVGLKKERENPGEVEGKQALFVVNLAPREMVCIESHGMLWEAAVRLSRRSPPYLKRVPGPLRYWLPIRMCVGLMKSIHCVPVSMFRRI